MALENNPCLTSEQKWAALEAVLQSQTFARADQLKSFLKYVCEMEIAERGHELTEYLIGIEALGRPANYSPGEDSAVRTRAFALRKKLQELYENEQPNVAVRIELQKGSYCPHFVPGDQKPPAIGTSVDQAGLAPVPATVAPEELHPAKATVRNEKERSWLYPFTGGILLAGVLAVGFYWATGTRRVTNEASRSPVPILAEAWGPLLAPAADALLCVANPPSFSVLPGPFSPPAPEAPLTGERPLPRELYDLYATRYPETANLSLTVTTNATYWGDVFGALTAFKTLSAAGVSTQIFPEMVIPLPTLRGRNLVLFGAPAYSATVGRFLEGCPLRVNYLDAVVGRATGQAPAERYALKRDQRQRLTQVYGLITVLPGESSADHQTRILIFSGVNSAGAQAAAEFFSSPEQLLELKKEFKKAGYDTFPPSYQVVVRAETDDSILLNFRYETYRIIPQKAGH